MKHVQQTQPDPGTGPPDQLCLPDSIHPQVFQWAHASQFSCHPGISWNLSLLKWEFRCLCEPLCPPALCVLKVRPSIVQQPVYSVTCPFQVEHALTSPKTSLGNSVILTIVHRFSKAVHFVALQKLPTALTTTDLLVHHMFCLHCIPLDIISDRVHNSSHKSEKLSFGHSEHL